MKTIDFPAGHSMDTDWFAVDKDGNIAVFDSGQDGAVPIEFERQTYRLDLLRTHTIPITSALRQLYLDEKVIENLLQKCSTEILQQIKTDEFAVDGCIVLLNENKKWEDLRLENKLANHDEDFALQLSPVIPLFLLSGIYDVRKIIISAIDNKVIAKACNFSTFYDDEDEYKGAGIEDLGIFFYDHDSHDWHTEPYCKVHTPEIPLKAIRIAPDLTNKIPYFKDISFENQYWIQPMEFFSCNSSVEGDSDKIGYAKVTSSDNQEEYCLLPISDQIYNLTMKGGCDRCYKRGHSYLYHYGLQAYQDYPPIVIIEDYYISDSDKKSRYDNLLKNIYEKLNSNKYECVITYCTKCYEDKKRNDFLRFSEKFQHCYKHLNTELSFLQPLLLIAIDETVINMLKTKYEITDYSEMPCLCSITIESNQYPLLAVSKTKTEEQQVILNKFLSDKANEIKAILTQSRNLPPLKPRVIRIEED